MPVIERYRTIVADPPWDYGEDWPGASSSPNAQGAKSLHRRDRKALGYDVMSVDEIASLQIPCARDSHLFLWTTNRHIEDAYAVARAWGFRPRQLLTWCKPPHGLGPGGLFSNTTEFVIYARAGTPARNARQDSTWWLWPRTGHSAKPDAFLDLVERACPGPYLEMFARRARFGWDYWGNESLGTVALDAR